MSKLVGQNIWFSVTFRDISPIWKTGHMQILFVYVCKQILALTHTYLAQSRAVPQPKTALYFPINIYAQELLRKFIIQKIHKIAFDI